MLLGAETAVTPGVDMTDARQHVFEQKACTNAHSADSEAMACYCIHACADMMECIASPWCE